MICLSDYEIIKSQNTLDEDEIQLIKVDESNKCLIIANQDKICLFDYECNKLNSIQN